MSNKVESYICIGGFCTVEKEAEKLYQFFMYGLSDELKGLENEFKKRR